VRRIISGGVSKTGLSSAVAVGDSLDVSVGVNSHIPIVFGGDGGGLGLTSSGVTGLGYASSEALKTDWKILLARSKFESGI
jgi:hypothetical protein